MGLEKLPNPHKVVLSAFRKYPGLLKGRVTNDEFVDLIEFYRTGYLDGAKLQLSIESAPTSTHAKANLGWKNITGPDFLLNPNELKVVSYTVTEGNGNVLGRHFVLLKSQGKNDIVVVDPHKPLTDHRYLLDPRLNAKGECAQLFLVDPAGLRPRSEVFEINTIFRISVDENKAAPASRQPASTDEVLEGIDRTHQELLGTEDFLSPRVWRKKTASFGLTGLDLPQDMGGSAWPATKMIKIFSPGWCAEFELS